MRTRLLFEKTRTVRFTQSIVVELGDGVTEGDLADVGFDEHLDDNAWEFDDDPEEIECLGDEETDDPADYVLVKDEEIDAILIKPAAVAQ